MYPERVELSDFRAYIPYMLGVFSQQMLEVDLAIPSLRASSTALRRDGAGKMLTWNRYPMRCLDLSVATFGTLNSGDILQNAARASASTNFQYYSVNVGVTHNIFLSSYTDYTVGSAQYNWLLNDLQSIDRSKTPW